MSPLDHPTLPPGLRARFVDGIAGLRVHVLEAGFEERGRPLLLLLHGFPELAYSWRKVMLPLSEAGFHVVAPDQRGYGRTIGWDADYDAAGVASFGLLSMARDALALVAALGDREVACVIGHDFGSFVAAWCALTRPEVFRSAVMMSAPFAGPPALPFGTADAPPSGAAGPDIHAALLALPRPRKHYQWYYSTRAANADMRHCRQGVHDFLRGYYHVKSADWPENRPFPLASWTAEELAKLPTYYIMDADADMAETVAPHMPSPEAVAACRWLTEPELRVYSTEFERTGFQGGLNWYRCLTDPRFAPPLALFAGRTIDVPSLFIAGAQDWGIHQVPGALEAMQTRACTRMARVHLIDGAGHWVQQEQPEKVSQALLGFLADAMQPGA